MMFYSTALLIVTGFTFNTQANKNVCTLKYKEEFIFIYSSFSDFYPVVIVKRLTGGSKIRNSQAFVSKSEFCFIDSVFKCHVSKFDQDNESSNQYATGAIYFMFRRKTGKIQYATPDFHLAVLELTRIRKALSDDSKHLSATSKRCVIELLTQLSDRIDH